MPIEIERKFLVKGDFYPFVERKEKIVQAYLCASPAKSVRVRIKGDKAFITIKGPSGKNGFAHAEFEYEIPVTDAEQLLELCEPGYIEKVRHYVSYEGHLFEVDVFSGENEGLVLAELELETESEAYLSPDWIGEEVTGDERYYNAYLSKHPYRKNPVAT